MPPGFNMVTLLAWSGHAAVMRRETRTFLRAPRSTSNDSSLRTPRRIMVAFLYPGSPHRIGHPAAFAAATAASAWSSSKVSIQTQDRNGSPWHRHAGNASVILETMLRRQTGVSAHVRRMNSLSAIATVRKTSATLFTDHGTCFDLILTMSWGVGAITDPSRIPAQLQILVQLCITKTSTPFSMLIWRRHAPLLMSESSRQCGPTHGCMLSSTITVDPRSQVCSRYSMRSSTLRYSPVGFDGFTMQRRDADESLCTVRENPAASAERLYSSYWTSEGPGRHAPSRAHARITRSICTATVPRIYFRELPLYRRGLVLRRIDVWITRLQA
mmetsp:Transcript_856/g.2207  ORF Transcript_856/g.2207 Transcript_856/m.2207 type:complete len:328 (-) Transcript_856:106-1089(-)